MMVIRFNNSDTSCVIFIALTWLLSSNGSITRTHLMAFFFRNETGTDFIFFKLIFSCMNSAPLMSKLVFDLSIWAVTYLSETLWSFWAFSQLILQFFPCFSDLNLSFNYLLLVEPSNSCYICYRQVLYNHLHPTCT